MPRSVVLPYFDRILERLDEGDHEVTLAFGRNVHWGYWDDPEQADGSLADFARACQQLGRRVSQTAGVQNGQRVLDVGCGFGGTLLDLDRRFSGMDLWGLNIDVRQLRRARSLLDPTPTRRVSEEHVAHVGLTPRRSPDPTPARSVSEEHAETSLTLRAGEGTRNNRIQFVVGDACRLPFADGVFDVVLCVEAIFHFPGRDRFFAEVRRVLRLGGRLALCDFVPRLVIPPLWDYFDRRFKPVVDRLYGPSDMRCTLTDYRRLARSAGLTLIQQRDVTRHTMPTYAVLRPLVRRIAPDPDGAEQVIKRVEFTTRIGLLRYLILTFTSSGIAGIGGRG